MIATRPGQYTKLIQTWVTPRQYDAIFALRGMSGTISKTVRILLDESLSARAEKSQAQANVDASEEGFAAEAGRELG